MSLKLKRKRNVKYFKASWCGNCRTFEPIFDKLLMDYPDIEVEKIDVDKASEDDLKIYHITDLPHIVYKEDGCDYIVHLKPDKGAIENFLKERQQ